MLKTSKVEDDIVILRAVVVVEALKVVRAESVLEIMNNEG